MNDPKDPLDDYEPMPPLSEQIEPYLQFGGEQLALFLLHYEKKFGGPGKPPAAADAGASYYCPSCEEDVRAVTYPDEGVLLCPLCGEWPGALAVGRGPKGSVP